MKINSTKTKNILHVVNVSFVIPYFFGNQFKFFNDNSYKVHVACSPSEHLEFLYRKGGFSILRTHVLRDLSIIEDMKSILKIRNYIIKNHIDVIVGHTPKGGIIAMIAAILAGRGLRIYVRHGLMYQGFHGYKRRFLKYIEMMTGFFAHKVICVSKSVCEISNRDLSCGLNKNVILRNGTYNGVDCFNRFNPDNYSIIERLEVRRGLGIDPNDVVLGYVGRISQDKGIHELLQLWRVAENRHNNLRLLLVGPMDERNGISSEDLNIILNNQNIIWKHYTDDIVPFYLVMDIFILLSHREGFPTVVLEASSMSIPVLTNRNTGCVDSIIHGQTGLFLDLDDDFHLEVLDRYIDDKNLRHEHGLNGRQFISQNFSEDVVCSELLRYINIWQKNFNY